MAESDNQRNGSSIGDAPTVAPDRGHGGGRRFAAGDMILGRYAVVRELGEGGMGVVYQCHDTVGGVDVAVKGLPPEVAHNAGEMEEVRANFQLVCDLRHPSIAGVRTLEKDAAGDYYLVMDLAQGDDLGTWMRKNRDADMKARLSIVRQIAAALDYAHSRKVLHRDIKPGNIMVSPAGRVYILDFGLAAQISTSLSRTSHMVVSQSGTPAYKSPEQWRGKPQGAAADQYALAVVAYRLLSGKLPFDGDNVLILCRAVLEEKPPSIKWLPSHANKALVRALAKDPHARFPNCTAFADALEGKAATGGFWRTALVVLLAVGAILAAGDIWLHFEKKVPVVSPSPLVTNVVDETPVVALPPATTPPVAVLPPADTSLVVAPPPVNTSVVVVLPPVTTPPVVTPPPADTSVVVAQPPTNASPNGGSSQQPTKTQKAADVARRVAKEEQHKAMATGVDQLDSDGWKAACAGMQDAEQAYRDGKYKVAERGFNKAAMAFEKMAEKLKSNGRKE